VRGNLKYSFAVMVYVHKKGAYAKKGKIDEEFIALNKSYSRVSFEKLAARYMLEEHLE
tara:strand:+ start:162 stop:335 length:174 start_codon:yes stop_codon:yes gene_type:complete